MNATRQSLWSAYQKLLEDPDLSSEVLKLGKNPLERLLELTGPSSKHGQAAWLRYSGVLYSAFSAEGRGQQLDSASVLGHTVLVQSALFGLVRATDFIPNYRLSAGSAIGRPSIRELWNSVVDAESPLKQTTQPVLDFRSNAYAALMPRAENFNTYSVEVIDKTSGRALNHFNKQAKGQFAGGMIALISQEGIAGGEELDDETFRSLVRKAALNAELGVEILGKRIQLRV